MPEQRRTLPDHPAHIRRWRARVRILLGAIILLASLVGAAFGVTALPLFNASPFIHRAGQPGLFLACVGGWIGLGVWAIWSGRRRLSEGTRP
ncbi:MAG: hypothetical protein ACYCSR_12090 [Thiomonas sp.]